MNTENVSPAGPRTYGNWRIPKAAGFGHMSFTASMVMLAAMILTVIVYATAGTKWAVVVIAVSVNLLVLMSVNDRHGITLLEKVGERMRFAFARRKKKNIYRSGPLAVQPTSGTCELPGILAASTISEHIDAYDRPYGLIHHGDGSLAVVLNVAPSGADLLDVEHVDLQVAQWGQWLADLGGELGIVAASASIETVPDTGQRLDRMARTRMNPAAPPVATAVMEEIVRDYRIGTAQVRSWVTITFDPSGMGAKRRSRDQAARDIGARLPGLTQTLVGAGAGAVHLMTAADVVRMVRVAYDPACEPLFEDALARGDEVRVSWGDAGPVSARAEWDSYHHDSGISRSWVMSVAPRGVVQSGVLRTILSANADVSRKRVTILYRPMDAGMTPRAVESDLHMATARAANQGTRAPARVINELNAARQSAYEEATGAGIVDFGIIVTATCVDTDMEDTASAVAALSAASRLQMRPAYGAQDSAFALGLPLGLSPMAQSLGA